MPTDSSVPSLTAKYTPVIIQTTSCEVPSLIYNNFKNATHCLIMHISVSQWIIQLVNITEGKGFILKKIFKLFQVWFEPKFVKAATPIHEEFLKPKQTN